MSLETEMAIDERRVDLMAVAQKLKAAKAADHLVDAIDRVLGAASSQQDLVDGFETLIAIRSFQNGGRFDGHVHEVEALEMRVTSSLFVNALILYCRGTDANSDNRSGVRIDPKFSNSERDRDRRLRELRNNAVAHYGRRGLEGTTEWLRETIVIRQRVGDIVDLQHPHIRAAIAGDYASDLFEAFKLGITLVTEELRKRVEKYSKVLGRYADDRCVREAFLNSKFDAATFFGNNASADRFWRNEGTRGVVGDIPQ